MASTRPVVLLGWPAEHSLSPVMHNAAFAEQDLDLVYLALPTPPDHLRTVVDALGAVGAVGANVTVPHKQHVLRICDVLTEVAEVVGAVNTLAWTPEGLVGDNTDAPGLEQVLAEDLQVGRGDPVCLLGTGGAARAAVVALGRSGAAVTVVGRRPDAAEELAGLAYEVGAAEASSVDLADARVVAGAVAHGRVVVNATSLGMDGEPLPEPFHRLRNDQIAYDVVYNPPETPFLRSAREAGAQAHHGLGMLVAQAALAYERWTGQPAPRSTMSAAALAALAHAGRER